VEADHDPVAVAEKGARPRYLIALHPYSIARRRCET
jgi:hypothetical protein